MPIDTRGIRTTKSPTTPLAVLQRPASGVRDQCRVREHRALQFPGRGYRREPRADALDGRGELAKQLLVDGGRDLGTGPRELGGEVADDGPPGAPHPLDD